MAATWSGNEDTWNHEQLVARLELAGIPCDFEPDFGFYLVTTSTIGRILLYEYEVPVRSGISLWLHCGPGILVLGLWSGVSYILPRPLRIVDLVKDVFSGDFLRRRVTPLSLPRSLTSKYSLMFCTQFVARFGNLACDQLGLGDRAPGRRSLGDLLVHKNHGRDAALPHDRAIQIVEFGALRLFIRHIESSSSVSEYGLLVCSEEPHTMDHVRLILCLLEEYHCSLHDTEWNCLVETGDAYYCTFGDARPERPRRAGPA